MTKEKKSVFWFVYGIFLSVFTAVVGALFIMQVWRIYNAGGKGGYTVPVISERFSEIAIFVYLWILAVLAGGVLSYVLPKEERKPRAYVETQIQLERLYKRVSGAKEILEVKKSQNFRLAMCIACIALCLISAAMGLNVLLSASYSPKLTGEFFVGHNAVVDRLIFVLPWAFGAGIAAWLAVILSERSRIQEVTFLKETLVQQAKEQKMSDKKNVTVSEPSDEHSCKVFAFFRSAKFLLVSRITLAVIAVVLCVIGIFNGGMDDILKKAINICTQCIGLG